VGLSPGFCERRRRYGSFWARLRWSLWEAKLEFVFRCLRLFLTGPRCCLVRLIAGVAVENTGDRECIEREMKFPWRMRAIRCVQ